MAQKVHPKVYRLQTIYSSDGKWFAADRKRFQQFLKEDVEMRVFLKKKLRAAGIDRIEMERTNQDLNVVVHAAKPGVVIGRGGGGIEDIKKELMNLFYRGRRAKVHVTVHEVKRPSLSAAVVARQVADDIEKRLPFRRAMKQAVERVMNAGAEGVRFVLSGRLGGAEIARRETQSQGKLPLQTLRADIDFAIEEAHTVYGVIGVKAWVNRGEVFEK
jgi:small subunit ribosomal protein S3